MSAHRCARILRGFASLATQNVPITVITVSAKIGLGQLALLPVSSCVPAYDKAHMRTLSFAFEIKRVLTRKRPWGRACQNG